MANATLPGRVGELARVAVLARKLPGRRGAFATLVGTVFAHRVFDLVPTVLYAAGLPVGRDMDGRVLTDAFAEDVLRRNSLSLVQTYEAKELVVRRGGA